jgi:hypothetical protein
MRKRLLAAKLFTLAVALLILSFGLCATGEGFAGVGTPAQQMRTRAGLLCLIACGVVGFAAIVVAIIESVRGTANDEVLSLRSPDRSVKPATRRVDGNVEGPKRGG